MLPSSVPDPWHVGTDPDADPNPQIRSSDQWIQIRMQIRTKILGDF